MEPGSKKFADKFWGVEKGWGQGHRDSYHLVLASPEAEPEVKMWLLVCSVPVWCPRETPEGKDETGQEGSHKRYVVKLSTTVDNGINHAGKFCKPVHSGPKCEPNPGG